MSEGIKELDKDGVGGTLYSVYVPAIGSDVSVYVDADGEEFFPSDC